jgi:hypothetical protein
LPSKKRKPTNSEEGKTDLSSLESTKKELFNRLWNLVPTPLRIPLVAIVVLAGVAISTQSYWQPLVTAWFFTPPPPIIFGGYVFADDGIPLQTEVRLLDKDGAEITRMKSDANGVVGFNVPGNTTLSALECSTNDGWHRFPVTVAQLKNAKGFTIHLSRGEITFQ